MYTAEKIYWGLFLLFYEYESKENPDFFPNSDFLGRCVIQVQSSKAMFSLSELHSGLYSHTQYSKNGQIVQYQI